MVNRGTERREKTVQSTGNVWHSRENRRNLSYRLCRVTSYMHDRGMRPRGTGETKTREPPGSGVKAVTQVPNFIMKRLVQTEPFGEGSRTRG